MEKGYKKTIMTKDKFIFHKEWRNSIRDLPDDIRVAVYDAIVEYGLSGIIIDGMDTAVKLAFGFIKERIDKDNEKYEAICARNRANGSKSKGRPPKTQNNPLGFENNPNNPVGFLGFSGFSEKESSPIPPKENNNDSSLCSESKEKNKENNSSLCSEFIKEKKKIFVKPTIEEIRTYCEEQKFVIDCEHFYDYYESNGWKVSGKGPMKDWKAAVRNWLRNDKKYNRTHRETKLIDNSPEQFKEKAW